MHMKRQLHAHHNRFCRWLSTPFFALTYVLLPIGVWAQGVINPPTMIEVTALSGQSRLGPIEGGVTMAIGGKYYVASRPGNGQPATVRAWNSNDTVLWSASLGSDDTHLVPLLGLGGTRLFIGTEAGKLFCFDALSGTSSWPTASVDLGFKIRAQPALSPDGTVLYVRTADGKLHARKTSDGSAYWSMPAELGDTLPPVQVAVPLV